MPREWLAPIRHAGSIASSLLLALAIAKHYRKQPMAQTALLVV